MNQTTLDALIHLPVGSPALACVDIGGTKVAVSVADASPRSSQGI